MELNGQYYTLITGASSGIGKAMAEEFARLQKNLLLISLPHTGLESQCEDLSLRYNIKSRFLEIDLRDHSAPEKILSFTKDQNLQINMLINNIGVGHSGFVGDFSRGEIDEMIMLNIYSITHLTNLFLKELKSYPESYILNMGSFGGFLPAPHKSIYMASKAYIYYFSRGLISELENTNV
ncbi:MAG: SDR family NAD(P)-dependent oxidoreductase, partial [Flavobacteriaceae bacterium]|nr:SDR family NAD(P)-dependent oxidoreductase [Flavobacteriaceae bacterium]